ncbi:tyrosine-type recombinase/integrase [Bhargavaea ginsengi]|uniref:tyrosine-type recombinase/integrase n=1 Tax=Bhargavaea ginsengi TaxID=426757 RepID=UPI003C74CE3B
MTDFDIEIDRYMLDCTAKGLSRKTMSSYEQSLKLFARYLEEEFSVTSPKDVTAEHIRAYVRSLEERGKYEMSGNGAPKNFPERRPDYGKKISTTTIANYVRNIRAFYSHLTAERIIRKNPTADIKPPKVTRKRKQYLEDRELGHFFRQFDVTKFDQYRDWIIARLILDTGTRISELLMIDGSDIDLRGNALLLRHTKSGKQRFVYFGDKTRRHLKMWLDYKDRYSDSPYIFPTNRGSRVRIENVERSFRLRSRSVGLEVTPHLLRNNFAKRYLMNGGDLATLSRLLGHASTDITAQIYLDFADREVMRKYKQHSPLENLDI